MNGSASLWRAAQDYLPSMNVAITAGAAIIIGKLAYRYVSSGPTKKFKKGPPCALDPENYTKCKLIKVTPVSHNSAMYIYTLIL